MALNTQLEDEQKKLAQEAVSARYAAKIEEDRAKAQSIFNQGSPQAQQAGRAMMQQSSLNPSNYDWGNTPDKLTSVEQGAVNLINNGFPSTDELIPQGQPARQSLVDPVAQKGSPFSDVPHVSDDVSQATADYEADVAAAQPKGQSVLAQSMQKLNVNRNIGTEPVKAAPTSPYAQDFNRLEEENGLPMGFLGNTAEIESGYRADAKNPNSSARGLFQFMPDTAAQYGLTDPNDPVASTHAAVQLAKDNQKYLRGQLGREPEGWELYLAHQQGMGGAANILKGDPNARAVDVLGREQVLKNGGNEGMTLGEFQNKWRNKYNGLETTPIGAIESAPLTPVSSGLVYEEKEISSDGGASKAQQSGIPPETASRMAAKDGIKLDENGMFDPKEMGLDFNDEFQHRDRSMTDSQSLWTSLLAGGVAALGTALAGGKGGDVGAAFFLGSSGQFINSTNQSHRYKNLQAMKNMGYDPASLEDYITNGDRAGLKMREDGKWEEYPDGSGRQVRRLANGKMQMSQGQVKWEKVAVADPVSGTTTTRFWNDFHGWRKRPNEEGTEVIFEDVTAATQPNRLDVNQTPQVWVSPDGKESVAVYTTPTGYVSSTDRKTDVKIPADWRPQEKTTAAAAKGKAGQVATDDEIEANRMRNTDVFNTLTNGIYNADGSLNTTPPEMDTRAGNFLANSNWANAGGGRGVVPIGENWLTSGNTKGEIEMRKRVTDAKTMQAQVRNMAIQIAKDSGASGINTVAEIRLFAESFPPIDFSSYASMITSMDNLRKFQDTYSQNYRLKVQQSKEVMSGNAGTSTLGNVNSQNEQQEKAAWKEMEQYYGGGQGAQYLTEDTVNAQNGQGNPKAGVTASGYRYTKL